MRAADLGFGSGLGAVHPTAKTGYFQGVRLQPGSTSLGKPLVFQELLLAD